MNQYICVRFDSDWEVREVLCHSEVKTQEGCGSKQSTFITFDWTVGGKTFSF